MAKRGIQCSNYFWPIHRQPFYRRIFNHTEQDFPICESVAERTLALPFHNNLKEDEIAYIVENLMQVLNNIKCQ
jgi:perosamine synthetase